MRVHLAAIGCNGLKKLHMTRFSKCKDLHVKLAGHFKEGCLTVGPICIHCKLVLSLIKLEL